MIRLILEKPFNLDWFAGLSSGQSLTGVRRCIW
jgi:hypothetical protein